MFYDQNQLSNYAFFQRANSCHTVSNINHSNQVSHQLFFNYPTNYINLINYPVMQNFNQYNTASLISNQQLNNSSNYRSFHNHNSRIGKRNLSGKKVNQPKPANYQKSCPGCDRYWKFCKCSNIKNRPDPQPYCKFVPPRMLKNKNIE